MTISDTTRKRRHEELQQCFAVIDSCLATYYAGATHMYRPLAGQLRILFCDRPPLLPRVFPDLQINPLRPIQWLDPKDATPFEGVPATLTVTGPTGATFRLARMPFLITAYPNHLQVADLEFSKGLIDFGAWMNQIVTTWPADLSIRTLIKAVANKGGGAHVDDQISDPLGNMMALGPRGLGAHVLFPIALARFAQKMGLYYAQFRELFGYGGNIADAVARFDPDHPTVQQAATVPTALTTGPQERYAFAVLRRIA